MSALSVPKLSVEEYLALDRVAEVPCEYHDGEMFPIAAVSLDHVRISQRLVGWLSTHLRGKDCEVFSAPLRLRVSPTKYVLPDLMVICGSPKETDEHQDTITNPKVILEILSPSTTGYDYGLKFRLYQLLASFEEYILVSQDEPRVDRYRKTARDRWDLSIYTGLDAVVPIESLSLSLPLAEIYHGIELVPELPSD